jgi:antitoxin component YwqK of YwqJK toxin-antitoxin module
MGKLDGVSIKFSPPVGNSPVGYKIEEAHYMNGKLHGMYTRWNNQKVDMKGEYENGLKTGPWIENASVDGTKSDGDYVDGKKHGPWVIGHSRLFGKQVGSFYNGLKDGEWTVYNHKGKKVRIEKWDKGTLLNVVD